MIAFAGLLVPHAKAAGMTVPESSGDLDDPAVMQNLRAVHPHFWAFCQLQLCRRLTSWSEPGENAVVIARIPLESLVTMTIGDFRREGVVGI